MRVNGWMDEGLGGGVDEGMEVGWVRREKATLWGHSFIKGRNTPKALSNLDQLFYCRKISYFLLSQTSKLFVVCNSHHIL